MSINHCLRAKCVFTFFGPNHHLALRQAAFDGKKEFGLEASQTIRKNFYVDDMLKSTPDEDYKGVFQT